MQITTPVLITKHCDSEIVALKEQVESQNIEIQNWNHQSLKKENIDKHIPSHENSNTQFSNNTFQGSQPQIIEKTPSSPTANKPPSVLKKY